jgi:geranylgeranyl pyrophosphate synthase
MPTSLEAQTHQVSVFNQIIDDFLVTRKREAQNISPFYQDLWQQVSQLLSTGGKRLRPRICVLAYQAFGGNEVNSMYPAAVALELLHLSMLIHDDIIDRDYIRYGNDNIAGAYNKKLYSELVPNSRERMHYARSAAMLGGDLLLSEAYALVTTSALSSANIVIVQKLMRQAIFEVIGGELLDTESAFRDPHTISAKKIALYKTASYSFTLPLLIGARLADVPEQLITHVDAFGTNLGIAFQLRDDIIGIFGNERVTGKSTIGDIREGKRTFMIEQFYALASDIQKNEFDLYFGKQSIDEHQAEIVRMLLRSSGAYDKTEKEITAYKTKARAALAHLPIEIKYAEEIEQLIEVATKRRA